MATTKKEKKEKKDTTYLREEREEGGAAAGAPLGRKGQGPGAGVDENGFRVYEV